MPKATCSVDGCEVEVLALGWCKSHYRRWHKYGDATWERPNLEARFWANVAKSDGCWEWTVSEPRTDYGSIRVDGRSMPTHRFAWELAAGPVPDGLLVLHACDNRPCVRNDEIGVYLLDGVEHPRRGHLWLGSYADNMWDKILKGRGGYKHKTHCKRGHPFDEANTYVDKRGYRMCKACQRLHKARFQQRKRAAI